ncbi:MAG: ABC-type antimicrobial peptide transport system, permease component [Planctomycetota bacterium]|nr:ABC-type antimicrobial peptide transport system, permease component [Planctomycetota bacterium]
MTDRVINTIRPSAWILAGVSTPLLLVLMILKSRGVPMLGILPWNPLLYAGAALVAIFSALLFTQQMSWIALKMLTGDKAKFFGIVLGLTFAALLITQQGSIFCGLMRRTAGQVEDIRGADLWVMDANVRYVDDVKPMIESNLYRVRGVEGVEWAVPLYKGNARLKLKTIGRDKKPLDVIEQVILLGVDDASLVGSPPPERILVGSLTDLRKTDALLIDFNRLPKLFPGEQWDQAPAMPGLRQKAGDSISRWITNLASRAKSSESLPTPDEQYRAAQREFYKRFVGREVEMNDHRGIIVGVCEATRTFQSNPVVYTMYSRAKQYVPRERKLLSYVLAKTADGVKPGEVAERIASQTGLKARTSWEFMKETMWYYFQYTGIPINFGITTLLGFLVGTAIAGQTFYNFTIENLKQFGSLKAMGATNLRIVGMILLQATVVGLLGYGLGVGLATLFGIVSQGGELAFFTWWPVLPIAGVAIVLICVLASILCIRRVMVLEPAVVFRG